MDKRAKLSIGLLVVGFGTGALIAVASPGRAGVQAPPASPALPAGGGLSSVATPDELNLWKTRGCATCHGPEARGSPMAPDLTKVIPLYLAQFGTADAAREQIIAYLVDPQGSPKLRDDGVQFPNPMPAIEKLFGGTKADAATLAGLLVRLAK